jgi:hypothetical protein
MLEEDQVIKAIVDQGFGGSDVDMACIRRLKGLAEEYGDSGEVAVKLLDIIKDILGI